MYRDMETLEKRLMQLLIPTTPPLSDSNRKAVCKQMASEISQPPQKVATESTVLN